MRNDDILPLAPLDPAPETPPVPVEAAPPGFPSAPPPAEQEPRPELGWERWSGSGPVRRGVFWDLVFVAAFLAAGVAALVLGTRAGEKLLAPYRQVGWPVAAAAAGIALLGIGVRLLGRRIRLTVSENGLVYSAGGRPKTIRWAEVTAVTEKKVAQVISHGESAGHRHLIRIQCKDGTDHRLEVGGVPEADRLAELIHEGTLTHLVPRVMDKLSAGRSVAFGKLVMSPIGLVHGRETLTWNKMANIALTAGILTVRAKGAAEPWYAGDCGAIPNVQVLLNLIRSRFLSTDLGIARNQAADESRYSVLDKYIGAAGGRRYG